MRTKPNASPRHSKKSSQNGSRHDRSLRLEPLEERRLLAITVDTLVDEADGSIIDGDISLRDAIAAATPGETINFSVTGTINMDDALGEMLIDKGLIITGPGANQLTIDAGDGPDNLPGNGDGYRIFNISDGTGALVDVEISGLTLTGGDIDGFGVNGGAILNRENLTVSSSTVSGNEARRGGAILNDYGTLTVTNSTISGNSANTEGGGITSLGIGSTVNVTNSSISGNSASFYGGGIFSLDSTLIIITDSIVSDNQAGDDGGGIHSRGTVTVTNSTISGNSANSGKGGGIYSKDESTLTIVTDSTISDNSANDGGGIYNKNSNITITNTTISGNTASTRGGGLQNWNGTVNIQFSTITDNSAGTSGGGLQALNLFSNPIVNVTSSIISGNTAPTGSESSVDGPTSGGGAINLNDYNLIGDSSKTTAQALYAVTAGASDITATSDGTTPTHINSIIHPDLLDLGGPTLTHGLFPVSPALDGGNPAVASPPTYDQRGVGFDRIVDVGAGAIIDIGAYEAQTLPLDGDLNLDGLVDALDFGILAANFGVNGLGYADGNINGDIYVDAADIGLMFAAWTGDTGPGYAQAETSEEVAVADSNSDTLPVLLPHIDSTVTEQSSSTAIDEQYHLEMLRIDVQQQAGRTQAIVAANAGAKIGKVAQADADQVDASTFDAALLSLLDEEGW